jgi:hypothetical protein
MAPRGRKLEQRLRGRAHHEGHIAMYLTMQLLLWRDPLMVITTSGRYHLSPKVPTQARIRFATCWPNFNAYWRTVSYVTSMLHAASISSTSRRLNGKRKLSHTA